MGNEALVTTKQIVIKTFWCYCVVLAVGWPLQYSFREKAPSLFETGITAALFALSLVTFIVRVR